MAAGRTPATALIDLLAPALRLIGDDWARGVVTVGDEHRASVVAVRLLGRIGPRLSRPGPARGSVLLACVPGELHSLPASLLAAVLRGEGYRVVELGADTPARDIAETAHRVGAALNAVALSVGTFEARGQVPGCVDDVRRALGDEVPVLVGGVAVTSREDALALGADDWAHDAAGALAVLQRLS